MSKELTPLEALEKLTNYKCSCMSEKIECKEIIKKALKALEIIKKCCLLGAYPNGTYELAFSTKIDITKEEYDLLKDVL